MIQLDQRIQSAVAVYTGQDAQRRATKILECAERIGHLETALQTIGTGNREVLDYFWQRQLLKPQTYEEMRLVLEHGTEIMPTIKTAEQEGILESTIKLLDDPRKLPLVKAIITYFVRRLKFGDKSNTIIDPAIIYEALKKYTPEQQDKILKEATEYTDIETTDHWENIRRYRIRINIAARKINDYRLPLQLAHPKIEKGHLKRAFRGIRGEQLKEFLTILSDFYDEKSSQVECLISYLEGEDTTERLETLRLIKKLKIEPEQLEGGGHELLLDIKYD